MSFKIGTENDLNSQRDSKFWSRHAPGWVVLACAVLLVLVRYVAWRNGFALLPWLGYVAVWLALIVAVTWWTKSAVAGFAGLIFTLYMGWELAWLDDRLAQREFSEICERHSGLQIYKKVRIDSEYFADGKFTFVDERGYVDQAAFPEGYEFVEEIWIAYPSRYRPVHRLMREIRSKHTGQIAAQQSQFTGERGGPPTWAETKSIKGSPCPRSLGKSINELFQQAFVVSVEKGSE